MDLDFKEDNQKKYANGLMHDDNSRDSGIFVSDEGASSRRPSTKRRRLDMDNINTKKIQTPPTIDFDFEEESQKKYGNGLICDDSSRDSGVFVSDEGSSCRSHSTKRCRLDMDNIDICQTLPTIDFDFDEESQKKYGTDIMHDDSSRDSEGFASDECSSCKGPCDECSSCKGPCAKRCRLDMNSIDIFQTPPTIFNSPGSVSTSQFVLAVPVSPMQDVTRETQATYNTNALEEQSPTDIVLSKIDDDVDMIGDFSKPYCLSLVEGQHKDLKSISTDTLTRVMEGHYCEDIDNVIIVDCRYPYEYEGGHIKDAINIYTKDELINQFITNHHQVAAQYSPKRTVVIFHCEFSSARGPRMARFLRNQDRQVNTDCYPSLCYPEIYILDGGYKALYHHNKNICTPRNYVPMKQKNFANELRHFRVKSKSWGGRSQSRLTLCSASEW